MIECNKCKGTGKSLDEVEIECMCNCGHVHMTRYPEQAHRQSGLNILSKKSVSCRECKGTGETNKD